MIFSLTIILDAYLISIWIYCKRRIYLNFNWYHLSDRYFSIHYTHIVDGEVMWNGLL